MKLITTTSILTVLFALGCQTNAVTGRKSLDLVPASEMQSMSYSEYNTFLSSHKLSTNAEQTAMVNRVGTRIQKAVETYMTQNGKENQLSGFKWEFNLIEDPTVNAWCMPGGKVVVYTGIMPVVENETGLAVVLGHEIAHAIANHGGERMSQGMVQKFGATALSIALSSKPAETQAIFNTAYNTGSEVAIMLPYSRMHESEADRMGLIFMAMAGYNPAEAVTFWQRMKAASSGNKPSALMSTHPSDDKRISDIQQWLPEVKQKYYKPQ